MTYPLACDEDGELDVHFEFTHLEGRGVCVSHEVVDEARVVTSTFGALAVGHTCCLDDSCVVAHVVDDPDEPMVEHGEGLVEDFLQRRDCGASGLVGFATESVNFSLLFGGKCHVVGNPTRHGNVLAYARGNGESEVRDV